MSAKTKAHFALLGTNFFFAANYSIIKYFTSHGFSGPFGLNIIRTAVCLLLFWLLFLFKPAKSNFAKKDILPLVLCALTAIALNQLLFIKGVSFTSPIHASLLTLSTPILITLFAAWFLRERLSLNKIAGLVLAIGGAVLLISGKQNAADGDRLMLGDILVILSAVAYTFYFILVKPLMANYSPLMVVRWIFTIGFFLTLPICYREFDQIQWQRFGLLEWTLLFLIVVPGTFLAYIWNVYGIKILSASQAGTYIYSQPVFAVLVAMIFLHEQLSLVKIIAGALIFAGVLISSRRPTAALIK